MAPAGRITDMPQNAALDLALEMLMIAPMQFPMLAMLLVFVSGCARDSADLDEIPMAVDVPASSFVRTMDSAIAEIPWHGDASVPIIEATIACSETTDIALCALQRGFVDNAQTFSICGLPVTRCEPGVIYNLGTPTSFGINEFHGVRVSLIAPTAPDLRAIVVLGATAFVLSR